MFVCSKLVTCPSRRDQERPAGDCEPSPIGDERTLASAKPLLVCKVWASNPSARPSVGGSAGGLIPWATQFPQAGLEVAPQAVESCVERVSRLYERGVDLSHIGAYVRRWQRWASSGLRALGEGLSERALELVGRSLGRLGLLGRSLPPLIPAVAGPTVGEADAGRDSRHPQG